MHRQWCSLVDWGFRVFQHHTRHAKVTQPRMITSQPASIQHGCSSKLHASLSTNKWFLASSAGAVEYTDYFCRGVPPHNERPNYDIKQSDGEVPVMLELWGMQCTPLLSSLSGPFWPGVIAPDRVLSVGQIEWNGGLILNWFVWNGTVFWLWNRVLMLNWIVWN